MNEFESEFNILLNDQSQIGLASQIVEALAAIREISNTTAIRNLQKSSTISINQLAIIQSYLALASRFINPLLRRRNTNDNQQRYNRLLVTSIALMPLRRPPILLFRNERFENDIFEVHRKFYFDGLDQKIQFNQFISTTEQVLGRSVFGPPIVTIMEITPLPNSQRIRSIQDIQKAFNESRIDDGNANWELEWIYLPETNFIIDSVIDEVGIFRIKLSEIDETGSLMIPDFEILASNLNSN